MRCFGAMLMLYIGGDMCVGLVGDFRDLQSASVPERTEPQV
jgi:hypothetical protein